MKTENIIYILAISSIFIGSCIFIANNYLKSQSITEILFGGMLLMLFVDYLAKKISNEEDE